MLYLQLLHSLPSVYKGTCYKVLEHVKQTCGASLRRGENIFQMSSLHRTLLKGKVDNENCIKDKKRPVVSIYNLCFVAAKPTFTILETDSMRLYLKTFFVKQGDVDYSTGTSADD